MKLYLRLNICICTLRFPGTRWRHIGGRLKQIESGPNGAVWGVNRHNNIYTRVGVSRRNPIGRGWRHIRGRLKHVTVGCRGVFGVNIHHQIWRFRGRS